MLNTDVSTCCPATTLEHGDIRRSRTRNASPCTDRGCKWPKSGRYVYVPVTISSTYSKSQKLGVDFTNLESFSPKSFTFLQKVNQCERNVQRLGYGAWRHGLLSWTLLTSLCFVLQPQNSAESSLMPWCRSTTPPAFALCGDAGMSTTSTSSLGLGRCTGSVLDVANLWFVLEKVDHFSNTLHEFRTQN